MSDNTCPYQAAVVEAARTGEWEASLRAHLHQCTQCADSARVTAWFADAATRLGARQPALDPTYIWLRAEIERRTREENASAWRRSGIAAVLALAVAGGGAAAAFAALPRVWAVVQSGLSTALAEAPVVDMTVISSGWLGLLVLLVGTYLVVLRPLR